MAKKKGRRPSHPPSLRGKSGHPGRQASRGGEEPPSLQKELIELLADDHPLGLLAHASATLSALQPKQTHPFAPKDADSSSELPPVPELLEMFIEASPESAALATAIATLSNDELLRARVSRGLATPPAQWPDWMAGLDKVEVIGAGRVVDALHDSDDFVVHVRVAGADLSAVLLVDFNLGTMVKDAFAIPVGLDGFAEFWAEHAEPGAGTIVPLPPADARAWIEEAIATGDQTWPPMESDSWPASRPLVEWVLRQLPSGGTGFVRPSWTDRRRDTLVRQFLADPLGAELTREEDSSIADDLVWFRTDYGFGDPLAWSPAAVEILMLDWYPRKIMADQEYLRRMPTVLRAFVEFAHTKAGLPAGLTLPTLAAIDQFEPQYRAQNDDRNRRGTAGPFSGLDLKDFGLDLGALGLDLDAFDLGDPLDTPELRQQRLAASVGGAEALAGLDDDPLPDEPFDSGSIPANIQPTVTEVLSHCDACCDAMLDVEHRTAVRRLLHDVALAKSGSFSGRSSPVTAAAALCWLVARANDDARSPELVPTSDLLAHFGLTNSPTTRIATFRNAVGADTDLAPGSLGSGRYLTGAQRRWVLESVDD